MINIQPYSGIYVPDSEGVDYVIHALEQNCHEILTHPIRIVSIAGYSVAVLPFGVTSNHILGMIHSGVLSADQVYIGSRLCRIAKPSMTIPQAYGYTVSDRNFLKEIITDPLTLSLVEQGEFDVEGVSFFVLNYPAQLKLGVYLNMRVPGIMEIDQFWNSIPGKSIREKASHIGLPLPGIFSFKHRKFLFRGSRTEIGSLYPSHDGLESFWLDAERGQFKLNIHSSKRPLASLIFI